MLSIGVLGFIVWSNIIYLMALLLCWYIYYVIIKNFTISWYILKLYIIYGYINSYIKSAGYNLVFSKKYINKIFAFYIYYIINYFYLDKLLDSSNLVLKFSSNLILNFREIVYSNNLRDELTSETLCENKFDFSLFRKAYLFYMKKNFPESDEWLTWFIGFSEGDGCWATNERRMLFILTQKDSTVLHEIQIVLALGVVRDFKGFSRYVVSNNPHCFLLYLIFNGHLGVNHRINQLQSWYNLLLILEKLKISQFDLINIPNIILIPIRPSLNDSWLSGFTDAEGCFSVSLSSVDNKCTCRYILDQKNEEELLIYIRNLFNFGTVYLRSETNNVYRLQVGMGRRNISAFSKVIDYFYKYSLKTSKKLNYEMWCKVVKLITLNKHNTPEGLKKIIELREELKKFSK